MTTLQSLRSRGFDLVYHVPFTKQYHVGCSQCEALAINGIACHETGCPNRPSACRECGQLYASAEHAWRCCQPMDDNDYCDRQ